MARHAGVVEEGVLGELRLPSPVVEIEDHRLRVAGVRVVLKRDDLIHPEVPGNKWRKLKYNLATARELGFGTLLTFGGAYSNHIRATAAVGAYCGFETIGVIRGEEHLPLNSSLQYAVSRGMRLTYLERTTYRAKTSDAVIGALHREFGDFYLIPEGGSNADAVRGCAELPAKLDASVDVLFCAVGTGGTLAGVAAGARADQLVVGVPVLKGGAFLEDDIVFQVPVAMAPLTDRSSVRRDSPSAGSLVPRSRLPAWWRRMVCSPCRLAARPEEK